MSSGGDRGAPSPPPPLFLIAGVAGLVCTLGGGLLQEQGVITERNAFRLVNTVAAAAAILFLYSRWLRRNRRGATAAARPGDGQQSNKGLEVTMQMLRAIESDKPKEVAAAVKAATSGGSGSGGSSSSWGGLHEPLPCACGISAAQLAALLGRRHSLRELQKLGADLLECHPTRMLGGCCLHAAALGSHAHVIDYLVGESGLYTSSLRPKQEEGEGEEEEEESENALDAPLLNGMTAAFLAAQAGNLAALRRLLEAGADAAICRHDGTSCLFIACKNGHTEVVAYLLGRPGGLGSLLQEACVRQGMQYSGCSVRPRLSHVSRREIGMTHWRER
eukprot:COSAG01_NODE_254_length_20214_cov_25.086254_13_plen_333_part_00